MRLEGRNSSWVPVKAPTMPRPVACCHHDSVCRSYITRSECRRLPLTPKSSTWPSTDRSKAMAVWQSGQKVTATGTPASVSLTISCHIRIWIG